MIMKSLNCTEYDRQAMYVHSNIDTFFKIYIYHGAITDRLMETPLVQFVHMYHFIIKYLKLYWNSGNDEIRQIGNDRSGVIYIQDLANNTRPD